MDKNQSQPLKKRKKRSAAYLARKAEKRRIKGENARSIDSRLARKNSDRRLSVNARIARMNSDLRLTDDARRARVNSDLRLTDDARRARTNSDLRRSGDALRARMDNDVRRSGDARKARKNSDQRLSIHTREARRGRSLNRTDSYREELIESYEMARNDISSQIREYELAILRGPTYTCQCCGCLFFLESIHTLKKLSVREKSVSIFEQVYCLTDNSEDIWLCLTCWRDIKKGKVPRLCLNNGLWFPQLPSILIEMTPLEERLVAPRLPFMQIRELRVGKQYGIKGNVVNVPISIDKSIDVLPRTFDRTETVQLLLKRMRKHKSSYLNESIRPSVVFEAAHYLVKQPLYIREGVSLNVDWTQLYNEEVHKFIVDENDKKDEEEQLDQTDDNWDETVNDQPENPNKEETLLKEGIIFAPGEGERPLSLLTDKSVEELSFPRIFGGQERQLVGKFSYSDICRSELKRADRRCCMATNIFFKYRMKEMDQHRSAIRTHMRKGYTKDGNLSAQQALDSDYVSKMLHDDEAYKVLVGDRSSPAYWSLKMKELMAMIRQLGIPTFFLTLSAAETQWAELLVILVKVLKNEDVTEEAVMNMSFLEKSDLIRQDPVTCARYFDHRVRQLFKIIRAPCGPFSPYEVEDTYIRVEFQSRGSPHVHCLIWLNGAPVFETKDPSTWEICEDFIDKFISCNVGPMDGLERFQYHKHSATCKKTRKDSVVCRFGIPQFPMGKTRILQPLRNNDLTDEENDSFDLIMVRIEKQLKSLDQLIKRNDECLENYTFEQFLINCQITEETYIRVIRNNINRSQVFIRRDPREVRTNAYSPFLLRLHRANMDLQFILDPYACVHYVLNYINKSNRGMSALLRQVVEECKQGNVSHQQKLYRISSKFINCSEVSIQEAVYILLRMQLSRTSRDTIFINTGERDKRTRILKMKSELEKMDPDSTDVMSAGLLEYYANRSDELEECCLAEFAAKYTFKKLAKKDNDSDEMTDQTEEIDNKSKKYHLKNGQGIVILRKRPRIIRYRKYQLEKEPSNYYREKIMLYLPWRDEDTDILQKDIQNIFKDNLEVISKLEKQFVFDSQLNLDAIEDEVEKDILIYNESCQEEEVAEEYQVFDLQSHETNVELEMQKRGHNEESGGTFLNPIILSDDTYKQLIRSLNEKQRNFLLGLINVVKTSEDPFYYFLTGGAGTGKSLLIKSVFQALNRWFNRGGANPDLIKVLMVGPTGKSAFNIRGTTIHSAFHIPITKCAVFKGLTPDLRNTLRTKLWDLKVIIIDEVSMVGSMMLGKIDHRLKEIFNPGKRFGGISILFVGDFNQLSPVFDSFPFQAPAKLPYGVLSGQTLWEEVKIYKLDEIMRQKDDLVFAQALNRLAVGKHNEEDRKLFLTRLFPINSPDLPVGAVRLFAHNRKVQAHNNRVLQQTDGELYISPAIDFTSRDIPRRARDQALYIILQLEPKDTYNLAKELHLKIGIQYMVSTNIDIEDGLVNGTSGILRAIDTYQEEVKTLWFDFNESDIGHKARSKLRPRLIEDRTLTPIERVVRDIQTKSEGRFVLVSRKQFPVLIAEAITIHKSQGQTYERVVIDMTKKLDLASFYTSFSRAKTLNGLFLVGEDIIFPKERSSESPVSVEMVRLETDAPLVLDLQFLKQVKKDGQMAIFFQNLPFLNKHSEDIAADINIRACDILAFVETRSNNISINGFDLAHSLNFNGTRPFGINFYAKKGLDQKSTSTNGFIMDGDKSHMEYLRVDYGSIEIFIFYISPGFAKNKNLAKIESVIAKSMNSSLLVIGDWNIDAKSVLGEIFRQMMIDLGLHRFPKDCRPSTDNRTTIDYIFASIPIDHSYYYESLISDHKPLVSIISQQ